MPISTQRSTTTITLRRGDDTDFLGASILLRFSFPKAPVTKAQVEECIAIFQVESVAKPLTLTEATHTTTHWVYEATLTFSKTDTLRLTPGHQKGWLKIINNPTASPKAETSVNAVDFIVHQQEVRA